MTGSGNRTVTLCDGELVADTPSDGPSVRGCPDGPWLVRGADSVRTEDGALHATTRPVVAVCACDRTQRAPWCDGTHKVLRRPEVARGEGSRPHR